MARNDIVMPQMGESITNGTITKWHKQPGDKIEIDEILLEISTDKVESEIPSPFSGRVAEILFEEGETIDVGIKIASVEDDDSVELSGGGAAPAKAAAPTKRRREMGWLVCMVLVYWKKLCNILRTDAEINTNLGRNTRN